MDSRKVINVIKSQLESLKNQGHTIVSIEGLDQYLDGLSTHASSNENITMASFNAQQMLTIEQYKEAKSAWRELFKATVFHAQPAIKLQSVINGGAAVALLAFIGKIWTPDFTTSQIGFKISIALLLFCFGLGSSALTQSFTYMSQHYFTYNKEKVALVFRALACTTAFLSLLLFFVATYIVYLGFMKNGLP